MRESHYDRVHRKHMRSRVKWMMAILLILAMGIAVAFVRLELGNHMVAVTAPFRPQYSANEEPASSIDLVKKLMKKQKVKLSSTLLIQRIILTM